MEIQQAQLAHLPDMMRVYAAARQFMAANGNPTQWGNGHPSEDVVRADIAAGRAYVCLADGAVVGAFVFFCGEEPTYRVITQGAWRTPETYGVIHRVASSGVVRGVARACFAYCMARCDALRIDTHADNLPMQRAVTAAGFVRCGIIHVTDGSARIAYDWMREDAARRENA